MNIKANIPTVIGFRDYHEIGVFQEDLRKVVPGIKISEVHCRGADENSCLYYGFVYLGDRNSIKNKKCLSDWRDSFNE